ncbi:MAG TPA: hypothetical protein VFK74_10450, partial [Azospira sp.]|nr:hypothetical protein [Azospira sp.]
LAKALAKAPEDRYQSAGELAADLRRYAELASPGAILGLAVQPQPKTPASPSEEPTLLLEHPFSDTLPKARPAPQTAPASAPPRRAKALWLGIAAVAIAGGAYALLPGGKGSNAAVPPAFQGGTPAPALAEPQPGARVDLAIAPWGEVVVDGEAKGISPPLESIELLPGHHEVEIRNGQSEPHRLTLELGPGDSYKIKHKFK